MSWNTAFPPAPPPVSQRNFINLIPSNPPSVTQSSTSFSTVSPIFRRTQSSTSPKPFALPISPSPESQKTRLTYQVNVPSSLGIKDSEYNYHSPIFSTNNNMFWQLSLVSDKEYYGIFILPVTNLDEIIWGERSKLSFELFIKEFRNSQMIDLFTGNVVVPHDTKICGNISFQFFFSR